MIFKLNFFKSLKLVKVLIKSIYSMIVYFLGSMLIIYLGADHLFKNYSVFLPNHKKYKKIK